MYANGEFVEQNFQEAFGWFTKAAEQGQSHAQYNLGLLYFHGRGVVKDATKAKELHDKSQQQRGKSTAIKGKESPLTSFSDKNCIWADC